MKIFQISDLHLPNKPEVLYQGVDTFGCCRRLVDHLKRQSADLLVVTGDIAADGENIYSYDFLKKMLNELPFPWVVLPGNHDRSPLFQEIFGSNAKAGFDFLPQHNGVDVIFFNNSTEEPVYLDRLKDHLEQLVKPVCLFTHYPPVLVGHPSYDGKHRLPWQEVLLQVLQKSRGPLHVFFGHIHFQFQTTFNHMSFYSVPSATIPTIPGIGKDIRDEKRLYYRTIDLTGGQCQTSLQNYVL